MRACGPCTECCFALGIHETNKRPFARCEHQGKGCAIYPKRPESCRTFRCLWLDEGNPLLTRKDRPDRTGIVFALGDMAFGGQVALAWVRKLGADTKGRGLELMTAVSTVLPVCIMRVDGTRSISIAEDHAHRLPAIREEFNYIGVVEDGILKRRRLPVAP